jgi:OPA family glycerol-3-phosphate transporter-like MFS transporter/OPA family sugar phosphate sensor protein UhpC-like MFS transporter
MALATLFVFLFRQLSASPILMAGLLMAAGFCIYGPQALVGIVVANLATNKASATAIGFTGLFGYASTIVSGWALGSLAHNMGWGYAIGILIILGLVGTLTFSFAWRAKADGYDD